MGLPELRDVTDTAIFAVRDSHIRFLGGVWLWIGPADACGQPGVSTSAHRTIALAAMIFVGGLARTSEYDLSLLFSPEIAPSLFFEVVIAPLLAFWFWRAERQILDEKIENVSIRALPRSSRSVTLANRDSPRNCRSIPASQDRSLSSRR